MGSGGPDTPGDEPGRAVCPSRRGLKPDTHVRAAKPPARGIRRMARGAERPCVRRVEAAAAETARKTAIDVGGGDAATRYLTDWHRDRAHCQFRCVTLQSCAELRSLTFPENTFAFYVCPHFRHAALDAGGRPKCAAHTQRRGQEPSVLARRLNQRPREKFAYSCHRRFFQPPRA